MANDSYKPNEYDEYRASDTETPPVFSPTMGENKSQANIFERLKRKNILIGVGVIVFIFIVYKIIDVFMLGAEHKQNVVSVPATAQSTVLSAESTRLPATANNPAESPIATTSVNTRITTLEQQSATYQTGIDKLNSQMTDMQAALTALGSRLDTMNTALQNLTTQMAEQQANELKKRMASHRVYRHRMAVRPVYFVRALVPGRAWLVTRGGGTITVGLGDTLPGYGVVQVIDPNQGTITTSTGAIIGYSPNEN